MMQALALALTGVGFLIGASGAVLTARWKHTGRLMMGTGAALILGGMVLAFIASLGLIPTPFSGR